MNAFLYAIALAGSYLATLSATAQTITNAGFETWATRGSAEAPANWLTTDDIYAASDPGYTYNTGTVTKSTDAHTGSFAAKLTNISFQGNNGASFVQEGVLILGSKIRATPVYEGYPIGGVPSTTRPTQFQFFYKLTGPASDVAIATLLLTKKSATGTVPDIIGGGTLTLAPTMGGYVGVTIDIPYSSTATPDSVRMQFSSGSANTPTQTKITAGSVLLLDDITLIGGALAVRADASTQAQLTVSPNPSPAGRFRLSALQQPALTSAPYAVLDLTGRVVAQQPALAVPSPVRDIDLSNLATGVYLLRVDSRQGALVRQLVVK
ncbi:T9SS type A sorting domain-containing protein [Hymenobacter sp. H14-R3]|uniref:T9SS type A sorting domain-containing protein n=1 Tax=Hymenobacter sp. H14-R3 TaxID=3046308 RepID=UPI0024BA5585|nr:T9SS type A sorting domain-containing protein [Hymenobacter sp. H14-R3]MDJ0366358.1 T9SS type A sorting domain-containing protein [Hymenobacter sp. H14-R3]